MYICIYIHIYIIYIIYIVNTRSVMAKSLSFKNKVKIRHKLRKQKGYT